MPLAGLWSSLLHALAHLPAKQALNFRLVDADDLSRLPGLVVLFFAHVFVLVAPYQPDPKCAKNFLPYRKGDAEFFQQAVRSHWSIENRCHWILDTAFREDHNQTYVGNAAKNLGTLRRIVLNILHDDPGIVKTVPKKRREAMLNRTYRERLLSLA